MGATPGTPEVATVKTSRIEIESRRHRHCGIRGPGRDELPMPLLPGGVGAVAEPELMV